MTSIPPQMEMIATVSFDAFPSQAIDDIHTNNPNTNIDNKLTVQSISVELAIDNGHEHTKSVKVNQNYLKALILFSVLVLNLTIFTDAVHEANDIEWSKDFIKTTLTVMGVHLVIEHILEYLIYCRKSEDMVLYMITACIRDIINNCVMTLFYIFDDYGYWWKPMMWGCYMADLVMLLSKWSYFKKNWLKFVFLHHFCVGCMLLILNHTTKVLIDDSLISIVIFMNSNTPGCASPIWKVFKLPGYGYSSVICSMIQRIIRFTSYGYGLCFIEWKYFIDKDYMYIVLLLSAIMLDIWDIYSQWKSIYVYYKKKKNSDGKDAKSDIN